MKKTMLFFLLVIMLLIPSFSSAEKTDPEPPINISWAWGSYEYRDMGYQGIINGNNFQTGDYFYLQAIVNLVGFLEEYDDIISMNASHSSNGAYDLLEQNYLYYPQYLRGTRLYYSS
jgi:hypothetical protein